MGDQAQEHPFTIMSHMLYTPKVNEKCIIGEVKPKRKRKRKAKSSDASKKRKLGEDQVNVLESSFGFEHKLNSKRKEQLASELGLDPRQVAVWFQNRRARWKNQRLEEENSKLKALNDTCLFEKCSLQTQVLKLKEELEETRKEIGRLRESTSTNSSSSSLTMDTMNPSVMVEDYSFGSPYYLQQGEDSCCLPVALEWSLYSL